MPGLTLKAELCLLNQEIQYLENFINFYELQNLEGTSQITLRSLKRKLNRFYILKSDLIQRINFLNSILTI